MLLEGRQSSSWCVKRSSSPETEQRLLSLPSNHALRNDKTRTNRRKRRKPPTIKSSKSPSFVAFLSPIGCVRLRAVREPNNELRTSFELALVLNRPLCLVLHMDHRQRSESNSLSSSWTTAHRATVNLHDDKEERLRWMRVHSTSSRYYGGGEEDEGQISDLRMELASLQQKIYRLEAECHRQVGDGKLQR